MTKIPARRADAGAMMTGAASAQQHHVLDASGKIVGRSGTKDSQGSDDELRQPWAAVVGRENPRRHHDDTPQTQSETQCRKDLEAEMILKHNSCVPLAILAIGDRPRSQQGVFPLFAHIHRKHGRRHLAGRQHGTRTLKTNLFLPMRGDTSNDDEVIAGTF